MTQLVGKDIAGTWSLNVRDAYTGSDTGTFKSWSITFDATSKVTPTDDSDTNGDESTNENILDVFFNLIFGDTVCNSLHDDCVPKVGGQYISYIGRSGTEAHSSIGLGGLNTTDGNEGFIIAGHAVGHGSLGKIIAHELTDTNDDLTYTKALGEVIINNNVTSGNYLAADVAFVEYPKRCNATEDQLCFGQTNEYKPTVRPLEIYKSNGQTYNVTGTNYMTKGEQVRSMGITSNDMISGAVYDSYERIVFGESYAYMALTTLPAQRGDSGGPVFSAPNSDDEVEVMGIISGGVTMNDITYTAVTPWYRIQNDLGLQSLP